MKAAAHVAAFVLNKKERRCNQYFWYNCHIIIWSSMSGEDEGGVTFCI